MVPLTSEGEGQGQNRGGCSWERDKGPAEKDMGLTKQSRKEQGQRKQDTKKKEGRVKSGEGSPFPSFLLVPFFSQVGSGDRR